MQNKTAFTVESVLALLLIIFGLISIL